MWKIKETRNVIYGLYCSCHPERGVRYVGKTIRTARERLREHRTNKSLRPISKWMDLHGRDNIESIVLEACPPDADMRSVEEFWINKLNTWVKSLGGTGMNLRVGGYEADETRLKRSYSHIGLHSGEKSNSSKLKEFDVIRILERISFGEKPSNIAKDYPHITYKNIYAIRDGKSWPHVKRPEFPKSNRKKHVWLTDAQVCAILSDRDNSPLAEMAKKFNTSQSVISNIRSGKTYKHIKREE